MTVKIGINGFGRIGRLAFRRIFELQARGGQAGDIEVAAINDLTTPSMLAYLLKYDSTHGTFRHDDGTPVEVTSTEDSIVVDGKEYKVYAEKDANNIPWVKNDGVEFVLECTGFYTSAEKSQAHINAGAKKVLISAPAKDETTPTVVFGVNHEILKASDVIVSAGSCTTNSMAAMVKLLDENWGIKAGFMTTIHAYTGTQMILDGPRFPKARNNRAAAINTIPHSTGAAKAIGKVVPSVNGKLQGHAQRIQVPDGSVTELTTVLNKEVTADEINAAFKAAFSSTDFYGYNEDGHNVTVVDTNKARVEHLIDTFVVLTMTALVVISTLYAGNGPLAHGAVDGISKTNMAQLAFSSVFGETLGNGFVAVCLLFFAFSTIVGWNLFGRINVNYLFGKKANLPYSIIALVFIFLGSCLSNDLVWELTDMFNQLMVLPNVIALMALSGLVAVAARKSGDVHERELHK